MELLYDRTWLSPNSTFPPKSQDARIKNYDKYESLFDIEVFEDFVNQGYKLYQNFDTYLKQCPLLMGYQRLQTIKLADMVVGAPPSINIKKDDVKTDQIQDIRDTTGFDEKLYSAIIDFSRFGHAILRTFNDDLVPEENQGTFAVWDPREWFPIFTNDGTKRIKEHVLAWRVNKGTTRNPFWTLYVQIHPVEGNYYIERTYKMDNNGTTIVARTTSKRVDTEYPCAVNMIANIPSSTNPFGTSDYKIINDLVYRATERIRQILRVLDKHADPSMYGPSSLLTERDGTSVTGGMCIDRNYEGDERVFKTREYYVVETEDQMKPGYLTWDGELEGAFKALDVLLNQIYIMSEMGEAMLGKSEGAGNAISAQAMRYKMIAPLEKARRVSNSFKLPLKRLVATLYLITHGEDIRYQDITVIWEDSLPKDPRETAELVRLTTGATSIAPLRDTLMEYYDMSTDEAEDYIKRIFEDAKKWKEINQTEDNGTQPNPAKKSSSATNAGKTGSKSRTDNDEPTT